MTEIHRNEDMMRRLIQNLAQDSSMLNEQCQKFGAPFKSFGKNQHDLLMALKNRNQASGPSQPHHNLAGALNFDTNLMERELQNATRLLQNSDQTKKESEEDLQHSHFDLKPFIFGHQTPLASQEELWEIFRLRVLEGSLQSDIKHQFNRTTFGTDSIYKQHFADWESKQRKIPSNSELNQSNQYYQNSLVKLKPI